jgi:hypothetical protein
MLKESRDMIPEYTLRSDIKEIPDDWTFLSSEESAKYHCLDCLGYLGGVQRLSESVYWYEVPAGTEVMVRDFHICPDCGLDLAKVEVSW